MVRVRRATVLDAPADAVWRLLRDFNGHDRWHPLVARSVLEAGRRTDQVGAVRNFTLTGGERVRELLLSLSDRDRRLRYAIVESDLPLRDYVAEVVLKPVTDGDRTFWAWSSRFRTPPGEESALARLVAEQVYEAGFDAVRAALGLPARGGAGLEAAGNPVGRRPETASRPEPAPSVAAASVGAVPAFAAAAGELRTDPAAAATAPSGAGPMTAPRTAMAGLLPDRRPGDRGAGRDAGPTGGANAGMNPDANPAGGASAATGMGTGTGTATAVTGEAMFLERYGGPEALRPAPAEAPPPGPGEVRLRHTAIGVNYIDVYCRTGYFDLVQPPGALGMEAAGTVIDTGAGVRHLAAGQRVAYACPPPGAYCTVRTLNAALVVPLPDHIDEETAAAGLLKGMTAEFLLHRVHALQPGEVVLVFAPAGGVGRLLCQWAARLGARVIGATSTEAKAHAARAAGAHDVILPGEASLESRVFDLTRGHGADVVYDGVGRDSFAHSVAALAIGGRLVSFGQASGDVGLYDVGSLAAKSATVSRPNFVHFTDTPEKVAAITGRLFDAIERRIVRVEIGRRYPLREAAEAHRALEAGETVGSTILIPNKDGLAG